MYCPKCGGQNSDDLAYCRHCGENLKIVAMALKGNAPIALVGKIDELLGRNVERLKRDAVWWTIAAFALSVVTIVDGPILLTSSVFWLQVVGTIILPLVAFAFAGRDYLAYRRSLDGTPGRIRSDPNSAEIGPGLATEDAIEAFRKVFCSSCVVANSGSTEFCRSCGNTLVFPPTGVERYLPQFLIRHLDRRIEKNAEIRAPLKSLKRIGILGIYFGASAVAQGASGDIVACVLNAFCSLTVFVISGWDYLAFIRAHPESVPESEPTFLDEAKRYFGDRSKQRQVVGGFVFLSVVTAFGVMWVPTAIPGIIVVWAILPVGFWLDIKAYRWQQRDKQIRQESLSHDGLLDERELAPANPWEFLDQLKKMPVVDEGEMDFDGVADEVKTSSLGVTEATTKSLSFDPGQNLDESVETQRLSSGEKESGSNSRRDLNESAKTQRLASDEREPDSQ